MSSPLSDAIALPAHGDVRLIHPVTSTIITNAAVAVVVTRGLIEYLLIRRIERLRR